MHRVMTRDIPPPRGARAWLARQPIARRAALLVGGGMALFTLVGRTLRMLGEPGVADGALAATLRAASIEFLVGAFGGAVYGVVWTRLRLSGRRRRVVAGAIAGAVAMVPLAGWMILAGLRRQDGALPILLAPLAPVAGAACGALLAVVAGEHRP